MKAKTFFPHKLVSANNFAFLLIAVSFSFLFAGCSTDDEGYQWLISQEDGSTVPAPDTEIIEGDFSVMLNDIRGDSDFLFVSEEGSTVDIYTIVLDAESPATGSLVMIREMSGDQDRVLFKAVAGVNGDITGNYSIDTNTDEMLLTLTYLGETYNYKLFVTNLLKINRTVYINSTLEVVGEEDTTPPELITVSEPYILWPPNHKYQTFDISDFIVSVSDDRDENISENDVVITSVTSDEPENQTGSKNGKGRNGGGDGNTTNDIIISNDGRTVDLRAERLGGGNGRAYTVFVGVVDASGNEAESSFQVHVPHNKKKAVIDDGVAYEVSGVTPQSSASDPIAVASNIGNGNNFDTPVTSNNEVNNLLPETFGLNQNYPNPFNPSTVISYQVPEQAHVTIEVFDITGRRIASLVNETKSQGNHEVSFNAQNMNSGVYFYRIAAGNYSEMKRMTLIK